MRRFILILCCWEISYIGQLYGQSTAPEDLSAAIWELNILKDDPNQIIRFDIDNIIDSADIENLMDLNFMLCSVNIDDIQVVCIRNYYIPYLVRIIKRCSIEIPVINEMSMGRPLFTDLLMEYIADNSGENINAWLSDCLVDIINTALSIQYIFASESSVPLFIGREDSRWGWNNYHYVEKVLYGEDVYMWIKDPLPMDVYERLTAAFDLKSDNSYDVVTELVYALRRCYYERHDTEVICDNTEDLIYVSCHYIPNVFVDLIGPEIRLSWLDCGRTQEDLLRVLERSFEACYQIDSIDTEFKTFIESWSLNVRMKYRDSMYVEDFVNYRNDLRDKGYKCAEYLPCNCPDEYIDEDVYVEYYKMYVKLQQLWARRYLSNMNQLEILINSNKNLDIVQFVEFCECQTFSELVGQILWNVVSLICNYGCANEYWLLDTINYVSPILSWLPTYNPYIMSAVASVFMTLNAMDKMEWILADFVLPYLTNCPYEYEMLPTDLRVSSITALMLAVLDKEKYNDIMKNLLVRVQMYFNFLQEEDKIPVAMDICDCYLALKDLDNVEIWAEKVPTSSYVDYILLRTKYERQDYETAIEYGEKAREDSSIKDLSLYLMDCSVQTRDYKRVKYYAERYKEDIDAYALYIDYLNIEDRGNLWSGIMKDYLPVLNHTLSTAYNDKKTEPVIASTLYDHVLLSKGFLLGTQRRLDDMMANNPDSIVQMRYRQLKTMEEKLDKIKIYGGTEADEFLLEQSIKSARDDIMQSLRTSESYTVNNRICWQNVRDKLNKKETAVEFVRLNSGEGSDSLQYVAIVLKKGWKSPKTVRLCSERELRLACGGKQKDVLYRNIPIMKTLYNMLWFPLERYMDEGERVYFSVDGLLQVVNMEVLRDEESRFADDKYDLVRLSSTRQLCLDRDMDIESAVLYGGLNYHMDKMDLEQVQKQYVDVVLGQKRGSTHITQVPREPLNATVLEIETIGNLLKTNGIEVEFRMGDEGIEESFKSLSGQKIDLLHIATHGFYMEGVTDYQKGKAVLSPMLRSGLVLSGAEGPTPKGEDGLLLAGEIADLDLHYVNMVVLSACETAQGDLAEDGVFGLQRDFKQAGAGTVVMSLWTVNSTMTQFMMTEFYHNMTAGENRRTAFKHARDAAKQRYPQSDWAAFIMLD